jgi:hypothetical protein
MRLLDYDTIPYHLGEYTVKVFQDGRVLRGFVNDRDLFSITLHEGEPSWSSSTCFPSDILLAKAYITCCNMLLAELMVYQLNRGRECRQ